MRHGFSILDIVRGHRIDRLVLAFVALTTLNLFCSSAVAQYRVAYAPSAYTTYNPSQTSYTYAYQPTYYTAPSAGYTYAQPATYATQPTYAAQPQQTYSSYYVQPGATQATTTAAVAPATSSGDAYGFLAWLNSTRASYGLAPVGYDANLESWAAVNNGQQAARGMGHFVMGSARRQNCAMGNSASIGSMWMGSPAHRSALLDPSITAIGLAGNGQYWTFNAY